MFQDSLVKIHLFRSERELGQAAAAMAAGLIRTAIKDRGRAFLVIATGKSQEKVLAALVQIRDILVALDQKCRQQQVGEGWFPTIADVPRTAVSRSIRQIPKSREILCVVPERRKAEAVRDCVSGQITLIHTASILQRHQRVTFFL